MSSSSSVEVNGVEGLRRVCVIFYVDENYEIYLVNRGSDEDNVNSDEDNVVTNVRPSLRIPHEFGSFSFCVVDGILYAFRIRINRYSLEKEEIFKVNLSSPGIQFADLLEKVPFMCKPKSEALPLVWGKRILLFSTLIMFDDCVCPDPEQRENIFDFEMFDPSTLESVLLPPLLIRRPKKFGALKFYNKVTSQWEELPISGVGSFPGSFFRIESYSLSPDSIRPIFSIQTESGHMFSIIPDMQDPCWILGVVGLEVEGYGGEKFTQPGLNFIYSLGHNGMCRSLVDACGVKCTSVIDHVPKLFYPFPLSSFDCYRSAINLLNPFPRGILRPQCSPFGDIYGIVRVGSDASCCRDEYVPPTTLDWCLDVLKIWGSFNESIYRRYGEIGLRMQILKSWKFSTVEKHVVGASVIGLFSY